MKKNILFGIGLIVTASCAFAQPSLHEIEKNARRGQVYFENTYHYDSKRLESAPGVFFKTKGPLVVQVSDQGKIMGNLTGWVERTDRRRIYMTAQIKGFELFQKNASWDAYYQGVGRKSGSFQPDLGVRNLVRKIGPNLFKFSPLKNIFSLKPGSRVGIVAKLWINGTNALAFLGRAVVKRIP